MHEIDLEMFWEFVKDNVNTIAMIYKSCSVDFHGTEFNLFSVLIALLLFEIIYHNMGGNEDD